MNIRIVCVGKIKESYYRDAIAEYSKRLSRFCKLEIIEVAEELCNNTNQKILDNVKKCEGQRILAQLKGYVYVLDLKGKQSSSEQLAEQIQDLAVGGESQITFVIGGSYGLDEQVISKANMSLCFGKITYPHQLIRGVLVEQIYRAFMINENSPYHK